MEVLAAHTEPELPPEVWCMIQAAAKANKERTKALKHEWWRCQRLVGDTEEEWKYIVYTKKGNKIRKKYDKSRAERKQYLIKHYRTLRSDAKLRWLQSLVK